MLSDVEKQNLNDQSHASYSENTPTVSHTSPTFHNRFTQLTKMTNFQIKLEKFNQK